MGSDFFFEGKCCSVIIISRILFSVSCSNFYFFFHALSFYWIIVESGVWCGVVWCGVVEEGREEGREGKLYNDLVLSFFCFVKVGGSQIPLLLMLLCPAAKFF